MGKSKIEWTEDLKRRFWSYVAISGADECWPWMGGCFENGYGQFRLGEKKVKAHRISYEWEEIRGRVEEEDIDLEHLGMLSGPALAALSDFVQEVWDEMDADESAKFGEGD